MSYDTDETRGLLGNDVTVRDPLQVARLHKVLRKAHWQFFLICLFDAMICTLLWCLVVETLSHKHTTVLNDAKNYTFSTSLLDVAASGIVRFLVLTVVYSLVKVRSTWPVVFMTTASSVFLIVKVYFYAGDFTTAWDYVMFGAGFILSWIAAYHYASKVSPLEKQHDMAQRLTRAAHPSGSQMGGPNRSDHPIAIAIAGRNSSGPMSAGTPAYSQYHTPRSAGAMTPNSIYAHSDVESDAFGTPDSGSRDLSPNWGEGGEGRDEPASPVAGDREVPLTKRALELNNLGGDAVRDTWELATGEGFEWQLDIDTPEVSVWSCDFGQDRRVLKSEGLVHVSPAILFHMLHENMAAQSSWNPIINRYEVVEKVDRYTDLTYTVTSAHAGGMISPRDFVSVRQWLKRDGNMVISETSVEHPDRPATDEHIRGLMGPGGYVLLSVPDQPHVTNVVWIFNADLKGWLPRYLVDQTLANLLMKHHECMRLEMQAYNPDSNDDDLYV